MTAKPIRILAIEDNAVDARRIEGFLRDVSRFRFELHGVERLADGLAALAESTYDVVLLDLMLADSAGLETLDRVHRAVPHTAIVLLTHLDDEVSGIEAMRRGAQDYLVKTRFDGPLLSRAIVYAIERKQAERVLNESLAQRRILEREVLKVSTREQQRISRDLHDSVGQQLTGLSYLASSLSKRLELHSLPEAADARLIVQGIHGALTEVRHAIHGLAPVEIDAEGLMVALQRLATSTQEWSGIECRFECSTPVPVEDNNTATHLYRVAQEAVSNAVKHAHASCIVVSLQQDDQRLVLAVRDNGQGIREPSRHAGGMGLNIMRYRARAMDATLRVASTEAGTSVACTLARELANVSHAS